MKPKTISAGHEKKWLMTREELDSHYLKAVKKPKRIKNKESKWKH